MLSNQLMLLLAAIVLLVVGGYAGYLAVQLYRRRQRLEQSKIALEDQLKTKETEARQSVQIIARALVQKDLSETEAAMRISWLSQQIVLSADEAQHFSVFQQLAVATAHIPILDDWAALKKSEKRRLNAEREGIELTFRDFIQASALELVSIRLASS
ncbi:MAG: DUF2489 domain-containing protein [Porticoccaceae bacterium]|nr:DUF2489 domain-containing protein [Porticoccaceae bacterium]